MDDLCRSDVDYPLALLWFWTFYILLFYICLNMLLAIVMDAYSDVKAESLTNSPAVSHDLIAMGQMERRRCFALCRRAKPGHADKPLTYEAMISLIERDSPTTVFETPQELEKLLGVGPWLARSLFEECDETEDAGVEADHERQVNRFDIQEMERRMDAKLDAILSLIRDSSVDRKPSTSMPLRQGSNSDFALPPVPSPQLSKLESEA